MTTLAVFCTGFALVAVGAVLVAMKSPGNRLGGAAVLIGLGLSGLATVAIFALMDDGLLGRMARAVRDGVEALI